MKKFNVLTTQYLRKNLEERKLANEALRAKARKALRRTILALVVTCGSFLLVVVCSILVVKKISAWYDTHTLVVKKPIEVYVKKNKIVNITPRIPSTIKVAVTDDALLNEEPKNYYELAKATGNTEAALFVIALFKDVPETPEVIVATFMAESGFRNDAMGWNCIYYDAKGQPYSGACSEQDRGKAWSVDCGLSQLNFKGSECPAQAFDPIWNALAARKKYDVQGIGAWVAHTNGAYLAHME